LKLIKHTKEERENDDLWNFVLFWMNVYEFDIEDDEEEEG